jgi:hypothetical protein
MRSFVFAIDLIQDVTGAAQVKQWATSVGNHYWQASVGNLSKYNIQGFKNIEVYGVDVVGSIQTQTNVGINGCIVNDWMIEVKLNGQQPIVGGFIDGVNTYALDTTNPINNTYMLGRFSNSVKFESPYISTRSIEIGTTYAQGIAYQTLLALNLRWKMNFVVYYKFEGE